jgi:acyl carrier protein
VHHYLDNSKIHNIFAETNDKETAMNEKDVKIILEILEKDYGFDELDKIEFIMKYEKKSGNQIPDDWL